MRTDDNRVLISLLKGRKSGPATEEKNGAAVYETRRQARGVAAGTDRGPWRLWLKRGAVWLGAVGLLVAGSCTWWSLTHVEAVSARVRADVVELSPELDLRLVQLRVRENQHVSKGEVLARLDDTGLRAALEAARAACASRHSQLAEAEAALALARVRAASDVESAQARVDIAEARLASAKANLEFRTLQSAEGTRLAEAPVTEARAALARLRRGARAEDIQAAEARLTSARALQTLYELEVRQSQELVVGGIDSQYLLEVKKTRLVTQQNAVREAELTLERMRAGPTPEEVDEAEQRLKAREAALAEAKAAAKELPTLEADMVIRRAELRETQAAARLAQAQQADLAVIEERVKTAEAELQRAQAEVSGREAALASTTITSPLDGTITRTYDEVGETCHRGVPTILIADDSKACWIEAFVREQDAMLVNTGQRARVKVPANGGWYVEAVVVFVGLHTQSLDHVGAAGANDGARTTQQPERVWVRLQPSKPLRGNPVPGTSARAVIRVR